jgi:hypothetical protein
MFFFPLGHGPDRPSFLSAGILSWHRG